MGYSVHLVFKAKLFTSLLASLLQLVTKSLRYSQHFSYFLQITHSKRPMNNVINFKPELYF